MGAMGACVDRQSRQLVFRPRRRDARELNMEGGSLMADAGSLADAPLERLARPRSLTEMVITQIRELIVSGRLVLGEQLSESALAEQLGVSRTPVREAFLRLETERLVEVRPQRGTFVFQYGVAELRDICELREVLETGALAHRAVAQSRRVDRRASNRRPTPPKPRMSSIPAPIRPSTDRSTMRWSRRATMPNSSRPMSAFPAACARSVIASRAAAGRSPDRNAAIAKSSTP